jgi:hypothetical protein
MDIPTLGFGAGRLMNLSILGDPRVIQLNIFQEATFWSRLTAQPLRAEYEAGHKRIIFAIPRSATS